MAVLFSLDNALKGYKADWALLVRRQGQHLVHGRNQ